MNAMFEIEFVFCPQSGRAGHLWKTRFLGIGSLVELRPISQKYHTLDDGENDKYSRWTCGRIVNMDPKSGQIHCQYTHRGNAYLYWVHRDHAAEVVHIDNAYQMDDTLCVFEQQKGKWTMATVTDIDMNWITVSYGCKQEERLHVVFDAQKLIFPALQRDIESFRAVIRREEIWWKLVMVTPTPRNTVYQCFAFLLYGDLNLAVAVKRECRRFMHEKKEKNCLVALCKIYGVRLRVFRYNSNLDHLEIVFDCGGSADTDSATIPTILLSVHLDRVFNLILDEQSGKRIPILL